jgi:hypothetical protein
MKIQIVISDESPFYAGENAPKILGTIQAELSAGDQNNEIAMAIADGLRRACHAQSTRITMSKMTAFPQWETLTETGGAGMDAKPL